MNCIVPFSNYHSIYLNDHINITRRELATIGFGSSQVFSQTVSNVIMLGDKKDAFTVLRGTILHSVSYYIHADSGIAAIISLYVEDPTRNDTFSLIASSKPTPLGDTDVLIFHPYTVTDITRVVLVVSSVNNDIVNLYVSANLNLTVP